MVDFEG